MMLTPRRRSQFGTHALNPSTPLDEAPPIGCSKLDFFKSLVVKFEGEGGVDEGGLTQEVHSIFWRRVIEPINGFFDTVQCHCTRLDIPRPCTLPHLFYEHC